MNPQELKYTRTHEWVALHQSPEGQSLATVGITDFAVQALADLVFIELPPVGKRVAAGEPLGQIESVKAVSDIYSPLSGQVVEVNSNLISHLEDIKADPFGRGWMVKIQVENPAEVSALMDRAAYEAQCASEAGEH